MPSVRSDEIAVEVSFFLEFAQSLADSGRYEECRAVYQTAIRYDSGVTARNEYGCYLLQIECYSEAIEEFHIVLNSSCRDRNEALSSVVYNNLAVAHRMLGHEALAATFQQQSIAAAARGDVDCRQIACALSNRGCGAILAGAYCLAEQLLRRALGLERLFGTLAGQAADWGNLGVLLGKRGSISAGIKCLSRAYHLHRELLDHRGLGMDLVNLAELFDQSGCRRKTVRCLRRAVECFDRAHAQH